MSFDTLKNRDFASEFKFTASRSSGAGGQNVNKVNTKVELRFDINKSTLLADDEKLILLNKLSGKVNLKGELIIVAQDDRSQLQNKENTINKFYLILENALKKVKKRKATKPTRAAKERRIETKKIKAETKNYRKKIKIV